MLEKEKYYIKSAFSAKEAFSQIKTNNFDVLLIKYQLPDMNGIEACRYIRKKLTNTPIIFLTKRGNIETKLLAFDAGINDYMVKPFSMLELIARINVYNSIERSSTSCFNKIIIGKLTIYPDKNLCHLNNTKIKLTHKEVLILSYLSKNLNKVVSRNELIYYLYSEKKDKALNIIDVHISNIRKKITKKFCPIETISGKGYLISNK